MQAYAQIGILAFLISQPANAPPSTVVTVLGKTKFIIISHLENADCNILVTPSETIISCDFCTSKSIFSLPS